MKRSEKLIDLERLKKGSYTFEYKGIKWEVEHWARRIHLQIANIDCLTFELDWDHIYIVVMRRRGFIKTIDLRKPLVWEDLINLYFKEFVDKYYQKFKNVLKLAEKLNSYRYSRLIDYPIRSIKDLKKKIQWIEAFKPIEQDIYILHRLEAIKLGIGKILLFWKFQTIDIDEIKKKYKIELKYNPFQNYIDILNYAFYNLMDLVCYKGEDRRIFKSPKELVDDFLNLKL